MVPAPLSLDLRTRIIAVVVGGASYADAARRFRVDPSTVSRLMGRRRTARSPRPRPHGGGRPRSLDNEGRQLLRILVQQRADATREEMRGVLAKAGVSVSNSTIGRELHRLGLTLKKKSVTALERASPRVRSLRASFLEEVRKKDPKRLFFVDESGSHIAMTRDRAWAPRGRRAIGVLPRNRGTVLTMIGALSLRGIEATKTVVGGTDAEVFLEFVRESLAPHLRGGDTVVMDGLGAHRTKDVRAVIEGCGAEVFFQPPYSPDLNPIEFAWSKVKGILRAIGARNVDTLSLAVERACAQISASDALAWFRECGIIHEPPV